MRLQVASYLRFAGFSVVALAIAACVKLAPAQAATSRPEPPVQRPRRKPGRWRPPRPRRPTEAERIAALEAQVEALAHGDRPPSQGAGRPRPPAGAGRTCSFRSPSPRSRASFRRTPGPRPAARLRPALLAGPERCAAASSLFYEAELGSLPTRLAAEAAGQKLVATTAWRAWSRTMPPSALKSASHAGPLMSEDGG